MSKNTQDHNEDSFENVEHALTNTEQFIENNQKTITAIVIALIVIIGGYYGIKKLYVQPLEKEAQENIFGAQEFFAKDSFQLALDGDNSSLGFLDIIDEYSFTDAGNLANYYAGLCYLHLGQFDIATDYLESFSSDDEIVAQIAKGAIGDAYMELDDKETAVKYYKEASNYNNEFTAPTYLLKLGMAQEELGLYDEALEAYNTIKDQYKASNEGRLVDKYIARAQLASKK